MFSCEWTCICCSRLTATCVELNGRPCKFGQVYKAKAEEFLELLKAWLELCKKFPLQQNHDQALNNASSADGDLLSQAKMVKMPLKLLPGAAIGSTRLVQNARGASNVLIPKTKRGNVDDACLTDVDVDTDLVLDPELDIDEPETVGRDKRHKRGRTQVSWSNVKITGVLEDEADPQQNLMHFKVTVNHKSRRVVRAVTIEGCDDDEESWEVDRLVDMQVVDGEVKYKVHV